MLQNYVPANYELRVRLLTLDQEGQLPNVHTFSFAVFCIFLDYFRFCLQASGETQFVGDLPKCDNEAFAAFVLSTVVRLENFHSYDRICD